MAETLKLAKFLKDDGMAEMEIWGGGVEAEFNAQGRTAAQFGGEFLAVDDALGSAGESGELILRAGRSDGSH